MPAFSGVEELRRQLQAWLSEVNTVRPSRATGIPPATPVTEDGRWPMPSGDATAARRPVMKPADDDLDGLFKRLSLANARRVWRDLVQRAEVASRHPPRREARARSSG